MTWAHEVLEDDFDNQYTTEQHELAEYLIWQDEEGGHLALMIRNGGVSHVPAPLRLAARDLLSAYEAFNFAVDKYENEQGVQW